jgi:hypothetical protein
MLTVHLGLSECIVRYKSAQAVIANKGGFINKLLPSES